jgi:hypothetical protein
VGSDVLSIAIAITFGLVWGVSLTLATLALLRIRRYQRDQRDQRNLSPPRHQVDRQHLDRRQSQRRHPVSVQPRSATHPTYHQETYAAKSM